MIEFTGDHRKKGYPDITKILRKQYGASMVREHAESMINFALATDHFISKMRCEKGEFIVDDDWCGLFIHAEGENQPIVGEIEEVLLKSKLFVKEKVDFKKYKLPTRGPAPAIR